MWQAVCMQLFALPSYLATSAIWSLDMQRQLAENAEIQAAVQRCWQRRLTSPPPPPHPPPLASYAHTHTHTHTFTCRTTPTSSRPTLPRCRLNRHREQTKAERSHVALPLHLPLLSLACAAAAPHCSNLRHLPLPQFDYRPTNNGFTLFYNGEQLADVQATWDSAPYQWPIIRSKFAFRGACACCDLCRAQPNPSVRGPGAPRVIVKKCGIGRRRGRLAA